MSLKEEIKEIEKWINFQRGPIKWGCTPPQCQEIIEKQESVIKKLEAIIEMQNEALKFYSDRSIYAYNYETKEGDVYKLYTEAQETLDKTKKLLEE